MSDTIHLLPDSIANQIAAGEVIQRPASVIKELVENAIDAQAKHIRIELTEAGRDLIRVIDDGIGMSATDARMAFERHATSKISKVEDLFSLSTMGFRGEALPSIAAVAQVELISRTEQDEIGSKLLISGSELISIESCTAPVGSIFSVKNLFFNIPARRKFLKSNETELRNVLQEIERIVLVHPEISFDILHNGQQIYSLDKTSLKLRIIDTLGKRYDKDLIPICLDGPIFKIEGFIGRPEGARKRGYKQFFFVNNRFMRHALFHKALTTAYEGIVRQGEQPNYFVYFSVAPSSIDVNIHPSKTEIKFEDEQSIFKLLQNVVRGGLASAHAIPTIDFDTQHSISIPPYKGAVKGELTPPPVDLDPNYNPFEISGKKRLEDLPSNNISWTDLFKQFKGKGERHVHNEVDSKSHTESFLPTKGPRTPSMDQPQRSITLTSRANSSRELFDEQQEPTTPLYYLYGDRYLITTRPEGLALVDFHRAHQRVIYDHFLLQHETKSIEQLQLLFPETISLSKSDQEALNPVLEQLDQVGFSFERDGDNYLLKAAPLIIATNAGEVALDIIHSYLDGALLSGAQEVRKAIALRIARIKAYPQGKQLDEREATKLLSDLFALKEYTYTADGKLIVSIIEEAEINSRFSH